MAKLTLRQAAAAVGLSRQTIYRAVSSGRLSVEQDEQGQKMVDTSELMRVFGPLQPRTDTETVQSDRERQPDATGLQGELAVTRQALQMTQEQLEAALGRENRLLSLVESQTRLLEDKRTPEAPKGSAGPLLAVAVFVLGMLVVGLAAVLLTYR